METSFWGGGSPPWTPAKLSPKPLFWALPGSNGSVSSRVTLKTGTQNVGALLDAAGSGLSLAPPSSSGTVPLGMDAQNGQAYLAFRKANAVGGYAPMLTASGVFPGGSLAPFTIALVVRCLSAPSDGTSIYDGIAQLGGTVGAGSSAAIFVGTGTTGIVQACATSAGVTSATWGTETLADGTAGTALPSWQVITAVYDGTILWLYVDGVLVAQNTRAITLTGSSFALGAWLNAYLPPNVDIFEAIACGYAWSAAQVKQHASYAVAAFALPRTATKLLSIGDSIEAGYFGADRTVTDFNPRLVGILAAAPFNMAYAQYNGAQSGWSSFDWLNISPTTGYSGVTSTQMALCYASGISPRSVLQLGSTNFGANDYNTQGTTYAATLYANRAAIAKILRGWGCLVIAESIVPFDATASASYPSIASARTADLAWLRANCGLGTGVAGDIMLDWDATGDTTSVPGITAWSTNSGSGAVFGANTYCVGTGGQIYFTVSGGTGATSGSGPTGTSPSTDGTITWLYLASAATGGALRTALAQTVCRYVDHVHLGTDLESGDAGEVVYALVKATMILILRGLAAVL